MVKFDVWRAVLVGIFLVACMALAGTASATESRPQNDGSILPIPLTTNVDPDRAALGEKLFNDPRLSRGDVFACATCHQLDQGGDDGLARAVTNKGHADIFNTPTVFNSVYNFRQNWAGPFRTLEEQAIGAFTNPRHGNTTPAAAVRKLQRIPEYQIAFKAVYPTDGLTVDNLLNALAVYQKSLITPNAPFDQFPRGDSAAISADEKMGFELFRDHGCISCHPGRNVGGGMFQKVGVHLQYFTDRKTTQADLGRYTATGKEEDKHVFRVPSLRNVEVTAPYFHDGSISTLESAVTTMGKIQLGIDLSSDDVALIVKFLKTLTGEFRGRSLAAGK